MEKLAYDYGLEMETPFVQKIREEGIQLGLSQGREEGMEEGIEKGMEEGRRQERELMTLDFLNQRFALDTASITMLRNRFALLDLSALSALSQRLLACTSQQEFEHVLETL